MNESEPEATHAPDEDRPRTIQDYIEERPVWSDGTRLARAPMTAMQWRIWALAAAGKFFEGFVVFITGVALPLVTKQFRLGPTAHGLVGSASLAGILVGAVMLGGLSDRFGRRAMFIAEMVIFTLFLALLVGAQGLPMIVACLFGLGLALGCDYPTAHMIISENIPSARRGSLVLGAFGFQALGALAGTAVGFAVLARLPTLHAWRWMYASVVIPALLVTIGRFYITESANWLLAHGATERARAAAQLLLARTPRYPSRIDLPPAVIAAGPAHGGIASLFTRYRRETVLASVPWFLQDLGTYGIGIFTPTIIATAVGRMAPPSGLGHVIGNDIVAARGAAMIDSLLIVGILLAVLLADRVGRIRLQVLGFLGCAAGLFAASLSNDLGAAARVPLIYAGFMLFNVMTNLGPNAQTYLIAGEVFPTKLRGTGAGLAAAAGKVGAVAAAFAFPLLIGLTGTRWVLYGLVLTSLLGALVTWRFRIETAGVSLDR